MWYSPNIGVALHALPLKFHVYLFILSVLKRFHNYPLTYTGSRWGPELSLADAGQRHGTPWLSRQSIAGLTCFFIVVETFITSSPFFVFTNNLSGKKNTLEVLAQVVRALIQKWIKGLIYCWTLGLCVTIE